MTQNKKLHTCPCCHNDTLPDRGSWSICKLCNWEDDGLNMGDLGPNHMDLEAYRAQMFQILATVRWNREIRARIFSFIKSHPHMCDPDWAEEAGKKLEDDVKKLREDRETN